MKFEEFKKYKKIAESQSNESFESFPDAAKIYAWMEETGRIDEGFFSAIWNWLKRNLSPTARKIHNLADQYEKELTAEIQAEYGKLKNSKDLEAKFRRSFAGRIAEDIEDKMYLIASDDDVYRELVRTLVNKKKLKVKKAMLEEFSGKMDPEDVDDIRSDVDRDSKTASEDYEKSLKGAMSKNPDVFKEATEVLRKKITGASAYIALGYDNSEKVQRIVGILLTYQNQLAEQKKADFTTKAIEKTLKSFLDFVMAGARKLEKGKVTKEMAIKFIVKATEEMMLDDKPVVFSKMESQVYKKAEEKAKEAVAKEEAVKPKEEKGSPAEEEDKAKEEVTTEYTPDILKDDEVEKTVHFAAEETDDATEEEIVKEINDGVKEYYTDNGKTLLEDLNKKIEEFNNQEEKDRIKQMGSFEYSLNYKHLLDKADMRDMEVLYKNLIYMAGSIVPYFNFKKGKRTRAFYLTLSYIFEIYAVKKDPTGKLSPSDAEAISANIKEKYT
jgi:hypothetical protein